MRLVVQAVFVAGFCFCNFIFAVEKKTTEELKHQEFGSPQDPQIKMDLAREFWCQGRTGLAYEHWLWILQNTEKTNALRTEAQAYLKALKRSEGSLSQELKCKK